MALRDAATMQTAENTMLGQTLSGGATTRNERNAVVDGGEQVAEQVFLSINDAMDNPTDMAPPSANYSS
ncbi:hypothetical protein QYF36_024894 [Acer negundo]|nr:hypothetical protein QYF36_024894 [Acer negundo]